MPGFGITTKALAFLFASLFVVLLVAPEVIHLLFGIVSTDATTVMSRRASILFLGLTGLAISLASHPEGRTQRRVAASFAVLLLGLALLGMVEWGLGRVSGGIWLAILGEVAFGFVFARHALSQ